MPPPEIRPARLITRSVITAEPVYKSVPVVVVEPRDMVPLAADKGAPRELEPPYTFLIVFILNVPFCMAVVPVYVFRPESVQVPVPALMTDVVLE